MKEGCTLDENHSQRSNVQTCQGHPSLEPSDQGLREVLPRGVQPLQSFFVNEHEHLTATDLVDSFKELPDRPTQESSFASYDVRGQFAAWPACYFARKCSCSPHSPVTSEPVGEDFSAPARDMACSKTLLEAHVRFGHRNFRSLAKALNLRLPAKLPFCKACVEAKATRHPKSRDPHPVRPVAVRAGARIYFDPFGPFRERLADGSYYAILFMDAFSTVLWLNTYRVCGIGLVALSA